MDFVALFNSTCMLNFNHRGFLVPNSNIVSTVDELKTIFVDLISNAKRAKLYENYVRYSNDLKNLLERSEMRQWIDGSFVTRKAEPGDIDMVTFIDNKVIELLGDKLHAFKYPESLDKYGVDAYLVSVYHPDEKRYPVYIGDSIYWMAAFDKSQRSRRGQRHPKGFLEIIY